MNESPTNQSPDSEARTLVDLWDACCDILSYEDCDPFLIKLFDAPPGAWVDIPFLCRGLARVEARIENAVRELSPGPGPWVAWVAPPEPINDGDHCVLVFFWDLPLWSEMAIYNRSLLLRRHGAASAP